MGLTPSERLRRKIWLVSGPFGEACQRVFMHPRLAGLWPEYMITQHTIIRSTVPVMRAGRDAARARGKADPVAAGVAEYFDVPLVSTRNSALVAPCHSGSIQVHIDVKLQHLSDGSIGHIYVGIIGIGFARDATTQPDHRAALNFSA